MTERHEGSPHTVEPTGPWRKSTFSNQQDCVELAPTSDGGVAVRNSNDHSLGTLSFTPTEWEAFLSGCKAGEFDDLSA